MHTIRSKGTMFDIENQKFINQKLEWLIIGNIYDLIELIFFDLNSLHPHHFLQFCEDVQCEMPRNWF